MRRARASCAVCRGVPCRARTAGQGQRWGQGQRRFRQSRSRVRFARGARRVGLPRRRPRRQWERGAGQEQGSHVEAQGFVRRGVLSTRSRRRRFDFYALSCFFERVETVVVSYQYTCTIQALNTTSFASKRHVITQGTTGTAPALHGENTKNSFLRCERIQLGSSPREPARRRIRRSPPTDRFGDRYGDRPPPRRTLTSRPGVP